MECEIRFCRGWIDTEDFESALTESGGFLKAGIDHLIVSVDPECRFRVDTIVILLSIVQQSLAAGQQVSFRVRDIEGTGIKYLLGMGFFEALPPAVKIPHGLRSVGPRQSPNTSLKLVQISGDHQAIPGQMRELIDRHARVPAAARDSFLNTGWMLFSELLDNIEEHSGVTLPAYAALQVYPQARRAYVAISDSGLGLLDTLRRGLPQYYPDLVMADDKTLLTRMASEGISRLGKESGRGLGIHRCLQKVHKLNGTLGVRFAETWGVFGGGTVQVFPRREILKGTHFSVELPLDTPP